MAASSAASISREALQQRRRVDVRQGQDRGLGLQQQAAVQQVGEPRPRVIGGTSIRRLERIATAPSAASRLSASRTGIWLTPSSSARPRVESPTPGVILPVINRPRSSS